MQSDFSATVRLAQVLELSGGSFDWQILASYRSDYFLSQFNERDIVLLSGDRLSALEVGHPEKQEGFATVNVGFGYTFADGRYRIEAYGQNITDEVASQKAIVGNGTNVRFLNDARTFGLRAIAIF